MGNVILRVVKDSNFTTLPNALIRDKNISFKATGFLIYLLSCADGWVFNFADLSKRKKDKLASTKSAAAELRQAGYLEIKKERNELGQITNHIWSVSETPLFKEPEVENQHMENQHVENRRLRSNNVKSTSVNKKLQQQAAADQQPGSSGLIFEKEISVSKRSALLKTLEGVEPELAQQMLDTIAQGVANNTIKNVQGMLHHFVTKQFTYTGHDIAARRAREKEEKKERELEKKRLAQPKNFDAAQRHRDYRKNAGI